MKLISFMRQGKSSYGLVTGDDVLDLTPILGARAPDLKALIAGDLLGAVAEVARSHKPTLKYSQLSLLPVIPNPGKIVCVGLNYGEHVRETGREITESPALFLRVNESQVAHNQDIVRPPESQRLDYEAKSPSSSARAAAVLPKPTPGAISLATAATTTAACATGRWQPRSGRRARISGAPAALAPGW